MEENNTVTQRIFKDLNKEERKQLRKEFNKIANIRFKITIWCGIGLILPAFISGAYSMYLMFNIFFKGVIVFQYYIYPALFTIGSGVSILLTSSYNNKFDSWLRECKNIVRIETNKRNKTVG